MASVRTWKSIISIIGFILKPILKAVTPMIRESLEEGLLKLYAKAEETENPIDDLFVGLLLDLLSIPRP